MHNLFRATPCALLVVVATLACFTAFNANVVAATAKAAAQKVFASPEDAFQALADAAKANDGKALAAILGPNGARITSSGDKVADKATRDNFAASYAEKHSITKDGDAKATLVIGKDDFPMPIPVVKGAKGWTFDAAAGADEILARRIGRNELDVIQVCLAYVDAQRDYASEDRDGSGQLHYALKFASSPGKKDGLYWPTKAGEEPSPLGPLVVQARGEGYAKEKGKPTPYHGYYYRILTGQGKNAEGGAKDYVVKGKLLGGFGLVAWPASYGSSGVMTFQCNQQGVVYEKDLGKNTAQAASKMTRFDPDSSWKKTGN